LKTIYQADFQRYYILEDKGILVSFGRILETATMPGSDHLKVISYPMTRQYTKRGIAEGGKKSLATEELTSIVVRP
jgi:hypothetical protein